MVAACGSTACPTTFGATQGPSYDVATAPRRKDHRFQRTSPPPLSTGCGCFTTSWTEKMTLDFLSSNLGRKGTPLLNLLLILLAVTAPIWGLFLVYPILCWVNPRGPR